MGGSGGGSSGAVSHSAYLEKVHTEWLDESDTVDIEKSITEVMNDALGNSPWAGLTAYDPDTDIAAYINALAAFKVILAGLSDTAAWAALHAQAVTTIGSFIDLAIADIAVADGVAVVDAVVADGVAPADVVVADAAVVPDVAEITDAEIVDDVDAFGDLLIDEIETKILPRFRRGMQDINAVVSSAFPIGESIIYGFADRDIAKYNSGLRLAAIGKNVDIRLANVQKELNFRQLNLNKTLEVAKANQAKNLQTLIANLEKNTKIEMANMGKDVTMSNANLSKNIDVSKTNLMKNIQISTVNLNTLLEYRKTYLAGINQMSQIMIHRITWEDDYARLMIEASRIKIVAKKEESEANADIDEADGKWDLEVFHYGANVMAAVSGGVAGSKFKPNKMASAIGGGLSGAAAGAMVGAEIGSIGAGYGAIIGAVLGAAVGFLSS